MIIFTIFLKLKVTGVAKRGGYRYEDGTRYIGDWNPRGQKHGMGHLILAGKRYFCLKIRSCFLNIRTFQMERATMGPF